MLDVVLDHVPVSAHKHMALGGEEWHIVWGCLKGDGGFCFNGIKQTEIQTILHIPYLYTSPELI